jgi:hypothetical protein
MMGKGLADLKVEDVHNNIGPAIQQNKMPANHHMRAVGRGRRQPLFELLGARLETFLEAGWKRASTDKLLFQSRR